jgi:hypothetical protein
MAISSQIESTGARRAIRSRDLEETETRWTIKPLLTDVISSLSKILYSGKEMTLNGKSSRKLSTKIAGGT